MFSIVFLTIDHSRRVTPLKASAYKKTSYRETSGLIYFVGYCILQEIIIFSNDTEKHWHTVAIVFIVSPDP